MDLGGDRLTCHIQVVNLALVHHIVFLVFTLLGLFGRMLMDQESVFLVGWLSDASFGCHRAMEIAMHLEGILVYF